MPTQDVCLFLSGFIIGCCLTVSAVVSQRAVRKKSSIEDLRRHMQQFADDYISKNPNPLDPDRKD
jgi:hypothetical protein